MIACFGYLMQSFALFLLTNLKMKLVVCVKFENRLWHRFGDGGCLLVIIQ